jgi:hypothetical protein
MSNYTRNDECVGCGEHISTYHGAGCVYDPDYESKWSACGACGEYNNGEHNCPEIPERTINDIKRELEESV